jgi:hypothetical protein
MCQDDVVSARDDYPLLADLTETWTAHELAIQERDDAIDEIDRLRAEVERLRAANDEALGEQFAADWYIPSTPNELPYEPRHDFVISDPRSFIDVTPPKPAPPRSERQEVSDIPPTLRTRLDPSEAQPEWDAFVAAVARARTKAPQPRDDR